MKIKKIYFFECPSLIINSTRTTFKYSSIFLKIFFNVGGPFLKSVLNLL